MQNVDFSFAQDPNTLTLAIIYGMVPAIIWLFFWLRENAEHKRRHGLLVSLFFGGALSIILTLPVQIWLSHLSKDESVLNILWAASEEVMKFAIFALIVLRNSGKNIADPVDYPVYIMTVALGFAGFENALYFLGPLQAGNATSIILSGSMRFLGTTLLHAACSCIIGLSLGFAFFGSRMKAFIYGLIGLGVAITVHSAFNHYIVQDNQANFATVFGLLWAAVFVMIFLFEILRRMGSIEVRRKKEHAFFAHIEELFMQVLKSADISATDITPLQERLAAKGFSEYSKLHTLLSSLRHLYGVYLVTEGSDPKTVEAVALGTIPEAISAKQLAGVIVMLKGEVEREMEGDVHVGATSFAPLTPTPIVQKVISGPVMVPVAPVAAPVQKNIPTAPRAVAPAPIPAAPRRTIEAPTLTGGKVVTTPVSAGSSFAGVSQAPAPAVVSAPVSIPTPAPVVEAKPNTSSLPPVPTPAPSVSVAPSATVDSFIEAQNKAAGLVAAPTPPTTLG